MCALYLYAHIWVDKRIRVASQMTAWLQGPSYQRNPILRVKSLLPLLDFDEGSLVCAGRWLPITATRLDEVGAAEVGEAKSGHVLLHKLHHVALELLERVLQLGICQPSPLGGLGGANVLPL